MKKFFTAMVVVLAMVFVTPAMALDLIQGEHFWGPDSWYDYRTYDESHPMHGKVFNRGHWYVGFSLHGMDPSTPFLVENIDYIKITTATTPEGGNIDYVINDPLVYPWLGSTTYDYGMFIGHRMLLEAPMTISGMAKDGTPIVFHTWSEATGPVAETTMVTGIAAAGQPNPPVVKIKKMMLRQDGSIRVKIQVPYDERFQQIRLRIFDEESLGAEWQETYKDDVIRFGRKGTNIYIPGEFAGRTGRFEYRTDVEGSPNVMFMRGMTYFKLPYLEVRADDDDDDDDDD